MTRTSTSSARFRTPTTPVRPGRRASPNSQQESRMATNVLHPGPPPLTQKGCQAAIDVIDLVAAEVRGVDLIDVTPNVRRLWQEHVVVHYPRLGPDGRGFLANADV